MSIATVTSKGQITLPADLRADLDIKPGDKLVFYTTVDGRRGFRVSRPKRGSGFGILAGESVTVAEMDEAIAETLAEKHGASLGPAPDRTGT